MLSNVAKFFNESSIIRHYYYDLGISEPSIIAKEFQKGTLNDSFYTWGKWGQIDLSQQNNAWLKWKVN